MAPQGATRIKKGLPFACPTGMELGETLRNTESYRERTDAVSPPSTMPLILRKGLGLFIVQHKNTDTNPCQTVLQASGEALIQSLSAFILEILCNARNGMTRIASYLRNPMTKQYIKFLIKADSVNESVLPRNQAPTLSIQESPAAALNLGSTASFAESNFIWILVQCCVISLLK